ncbi:MarC family protein [Lujinxingia vulgaris]|uniref:MarC family protein n=1 Tax=Lujinxingia vulgaris TaxID=2600176 RepID=UPI001E2A8DEB|nr:MarC family protein [Lujinxingia vulgaris]
MDTILQGIITMISLVNPLVCLAMFANIEQDQPRETQLKDAAQVALATVVILAGAALLGTRILEMFGVSIDAFSVTGGAVLVGIGAAMLGGRQTPTNPDPAQKTGAHSSPEPAEPDSERAIHQASLTPLILFSAGPGPITGVITLAAQSQQTLPLTALIAVGVTCALLWITLFVPARKAPSKSSPAGEGAPVDTSPAKEDESSSFYRDIGTRFMGLIVVAMGVQIALTGIKGFFEIGT